jgi:hypothetical protein
VSVRLYVLRTLAELGPMLGHQIRSEAQTNRTELWTDEAGLHEAVKRADGHVKARPQRDQASADVTQRNRNTTPGEQQLMSCR